MVRFRPLPARHERLVHLYRCGRCGEEAWYVLVLPEHLLDHPRQHDVGPRCGGRLAHVASGYEHTDAAAWAARSAARRC